MHSFDVAILGGGLAGNLLARHLRRALPDLSVALFERRPQTSFKVGESTVEIASNYLGRRLGLTPYLYDQQLPKNGLRFFFDTADKDAEISRMSEIGTDALPFHPSFQIDRARLEADLRRMNQEDGVTLETGVTVRDVTLSTGSGPHAVAVEGAGVTRTVTARWVVDASGRAGVLSKRLDLRVPTPDVGICASWARYRNLVDLDALGDEAYRRRARHTCRMLSTTHFMYEGYWIWFIPLRNGVVSVGVVCDRRFCDKRLLTREGLLAFLDAHRVCRDILAPAELMDFIAYPQLSYATRRFFGDNRWAAIGEAAAFTDPFYSPGSDFISIENDFVVDLIARDVRGESIAERTALVEEWMQFRFAATLLLYREQYPLFGSFELMTAKWDFDIAGYYSLWVWPYMRDMHLDDAFLRMQLREKRHVLAALRGFAEMFGRAREHLHRRRAYHRRNLGEFVLPLRHVDFVRAMGDAYDADAARAHAMAAYNRARDVALDLMAADRGAAVPRGGTALPAFVRDEPIA